MKIEILSMQDINNYGSLLQSYALKKILTQLGHDVYFLPIEVRPEENELMKNYYLPFANQEKKKFDKIRKLDRYLLNRICNKINRHYYSQMCDTFRRDYLDIHRKSDRHRYDVCVIGSDEVFNCTQNAAWGFTSQLFGDVKNAEMVITYAASCGHTKYEQIPDAIKPLICKALNSLKYISVRDQNTAEFVSKFGLKSIVNLDPVAIGEFDTEIRKNDVSDKLPKRYCILYTYSSRFNSKEEVDIIKKFCKTNDMKLLCVQGIKFWHMSKKDELLNPFEVLSAFKNAEFVITDTFHGTIFSAKYAKKFCVLIRDNNRNKISDLIDRLNIRCHLIDSIKDIDKTYLIEKDQESIDKIIVDERKKTLNYLFKVLI